MCKKIIQIIRTSKVDAIKYQIDEKTQKIKFLSGWHRNVESEK
jgi:hypothetical protein